MEEEDSQGLVTFRITLLGKSQSGKTALASAFINNFCPFVYTPTDDPVLYYKTVCLAPMPRESDAHSDVVSNVGSERTGVSDAPGEPLKVLVELEDTYGSERTDGVCRHNIARGGGFFFEMFATDADKKRWETERVKRDAGTQLVQTPLHMPFYNQPTPELGKYSTVAAVRMAFVIVFDANDRDSFNEAIRIMDEVEGRIAKNKDAVKPIKLLVANKVDEDNIMPSQTHLRRILQEANERGSKAGVDVEVISAFKLKRVKAMFFNKILRKIERPPADAFWKRTIKKPTVVKTGGKMTAFQNASAGMARLGRAASIPQPQQITRNQSAGSQSMPQNAPPGSNPQDCTMQ